jgi:Transposase, Mutator family
LSTNVLERLNQELKRRTHVIRIFPNGASSLRLLRALAVEIHEDWLETPRYLNMEALREQRKTEVGGFLAAAWVPVTQRMKNKWGVISNDLNNAEALFTTGPARADRLRRAVSPAQLPSLARLSQLDAKMRYFSVSIVRRGA